MGEGGLNRQKKKADARRQKEPETQWKQEQNVRENFLLTEVPTHIYNHLYWTLLYKNMQKIFF